MSMKNKDFEEEKPWYEQDSDGAWYREWENSGKEDFLKKDEKDEKSETEKNDGKKENLGRGEKESKIVSKRGFVADMPATEKEIFAEGEVFCSEEGETFPTDWEEYGKVYLPDPPPRSAVKEIGNEKAYIDEILKKVFPKAEERKKKINRGGIVMLVFFLLMGACGMLVAAGGDILYAVFELFVSFVFLLIAIYCFSKKNEFGTSDGLFLIEPHAVKKKYGASQLNASMRIGRYTYISTASDFGLIVYYMEQGTEHETETEMIYTEKQIDRFISDFQKGRLIVACKKGNFFKENRALICEPEPAEED